MDTHMHQACIFSWPREARSSRRLAKGGRALVDRVPGTAPAWLQQTTGAYAHAAALEQVTVPRPLKTKRL